MPLPAGFKVNGSVTTALSSALIPPRIQKIKTLLDKLPVGELLTSMELALRLALSVGGYGFQHPALADYREKVDRKLFWGSLSSIAQLREQLETPEDTNDQDSRCGEKI
jgi:hypothetical protein